MEEKGMKKRVLVVGNGGREHAIVHTLAKSKRVEKVFVYPGNGGTEMMGKKSLGRVESDRVVNVDTAKQGIEDIVQFAKRERVDLVCVGPELPLVNGIADELHKENIKCFGPSKLAARLEGSKAFAKAFMLRHSIPTAQYGSFTDFEQATDYMKAMFENKTQVVIKASGLAAGKGVLIPESTEEAFVALERVLKQKEFGEEACSEVVLEEKLEGQEASILAFCDGKSVFVMPPSQDHKRAYDGDLGPNTGGMGAYCPAPIVTREIEKQAIEIMQRAVTGAAQEGFPFVGVLYAGLMLTSSGPRVLEFNCRFGDPETQVILPLLESDLFTIMEACCDQDLAKAGRIKFSNRYAATVVAASGGYPGKYEKGKEIMGIEGAEAESKDIVVFHAGTKLDDGVLQTCGGRVLSVTATGPTLKRAIDTAYKGLHQISFAGMEYRKDIGKKALVLDEQNGSSWSQLEHRLGLDQLLLELDKPPVQALLASIALISAGVGFALGRRT